MSPLPARAVFVYILADLSLSSLAEVKEVEQVLGPEEIVAEDEFAKFEGTPLALCHRLLEPSASPKRAQLFTI